MSATAVHQSATVCTFHTHQPLVYSQQCVYTCSDIAARNFSLSIFSLSLIDGRGFRGQALGVRGGGGAYHVVGKCAVCVLSLTHWQMSIR